MVRVGPDGSRALVPVPEQSWTFTSVVAGPDDDAWVTLCRDGGQDPCPSGTDLVRWHDERWSSVAYPDRDVVALAAPADGGLWVRLRGAEGADPELARYDGGSWTRWADLGSPRSVAAAEDGSVCMITSGAPELVCIDAAGAAARSEVPVAGRMSIGPDGSLWVVGDGGVAVLATRAP